MRLLVTGASGGLGRAFLQRVPGHHDVDALTHEDLDIGDHDAVMGTVPLLAPDAILNFAAFTKVDGNQTDPARAFRDNALGPQSLALAARACGAMLLHVSTDYVFDGRKGAAYDETDLPSPLSVYGKAKLAGEEHVRHLVPEHFVVRTGYVFGGGADYLSQALLRLRVGEQVGALRDRFGSPTYAGHLAERILPLLLTGRYGTYHLAGPERACWFDVLGNLKGMAGVSGEVVPQTAVSLDLPAPRPADSSLVSVFLPHMPVRPMPPLEAALKEFLEGAA